MNLFYPWLNYMSISHCFVLIKFKFSFTENYCYMLTVVLMMDFLISNDWREILKLKINHIIHIFKKVKKSSIVYYCAVLIVVVS